MPVEERTETVTVEEEKVTKIYHCDANLLPDIECEEAATGFDPKTDDCVSNPNCHSQHNINFVAVNPFIGNKERQGKIILNSELDEQLGVYVCNEHIELVGDIIIEKASKEE